MNLDLQTLSTDTLLYMLMHSAAFVLIMGTVFFLIGLAFGHVTWGRYKQQSRLQAAEIDAQLEEIATLKRKLGEQSVRPGGGHMVTEVLPTLPTPPSLSVPAAVAEVAPPPVLPATSPENAGPTRRVSSRAKNILIPEVLSTPEPPQPAHAPSALAAIISPTPPASKKQPPSEPTAPSVPSDVGGSGLGAVDLGIEGIFPEVPPAPPSTVKPELDEKLGLVFKTPPPVTERDDLTAMKGIAKVLEARLHEFGIYTYAQIAAWDEPLIKEFSTRLAFKDRITREDWVGQAQRLHAEKTPKQPEPLSSR